MEPFRRKYTSENPSDLPASGRQERSDRTENLPEDISSLQRRFDSSLHLDARPRTQSSDASNEQSRTSHQGIGTTPLPRQSSVRESQSYPHDSSSGAFRGPQDSYKGPSACQKDVDEKQFATGQQQPLYSRTIPPPSFYPNPQYSVPYQPNVAPASHQPSANPTQCYQSVNPVQHDAHAQPGQHTFVERDATLMRELDQLLYRCQSVLYTMGQSSINRRQLLQPVHPGQHSSQQQLPAQNVYLVPHIAVPASHAAGTQHQVPMFPIRTNAAPIIIGEPHRASAPRFSYVTQATPARFVHPPPNFQSCSRINYSTGPIPAPQAPSRFNRPPGPVPQDPSKIHQPPEAIQIQFDLTPQFPNQIFSLPVESPSRTEPEQFGNQAFLKPETKEQAKTLRKFKKLASVSPRSKKSELRVGIPTKLSPTSYFPSYSTPEGGKVLRPMTPPFPPQSTSSSDYLQPCGAAGPEINPQNQWMHLPPPSVPITYGYACVQPVVSDPTVCQPGTQYVVPGQSYAHVHYHLQTSIQAQNLPYGTQHESTTSNLQDPNQTYQHGMQTSAGCTASCNVTYSQACDANTSYQYEPNIYGEQTYSAYQSSTDLDQPLTYSEYSESIAVTIPEDDSSQEPE